MRCVRQKAHVGTDRALNAEIVEENLVGHDVREGLLESLSTTINNVFLIFLSLRATTYGVRPAARSIFCSPDSE